MPSKAKFSAKTKQTIVERDKYCIFCWGQGSECHHIYFWQETNYGTDRNNVNQWILVCRTCHNEIHSCPRWEWKRQEAIDILKGI